MGRGPFLGDDQEPVVLVDVSRAARTAPIHAGTVPGLQREASEIRGGGSLHGGVRGRDQVFGRFAVCLCVSAATARLQDIGGGAGQSAATGERERASKGRKRETQRPMEQQREFEEKYRRQNMNENESEND